MTQFSSSDHAINPLFVLLSTSAGCAMTVLDTNVVAIILPTIAREFHANFADVEWVISTFVLCFAALLLPAGAIADRYGRKRIYLAGTLAFAATSLLCGFAPSAPALYLARALQGASAAFLLAPALAIIGHSFHETHERNKAWAIWGSIMGLTMVLSPIIGGVITNFLGWRWAFFINLPICALLSGSVIVCVGESCDNDARTLDPTGIILFATLMFAITWGLISGPAHGWGSWYTLSGFAGGITTLIFFIHAEKKQSRPMLDLSLFTNPHFAGAVWAMFAYAASAQVMASMLPLFLQNGLGRTAFQSGFAMLPFALAMLFFPHVGRRLERYLSSRGILTSGLLLVATGNTLTACGAKFAISPLIMAGMLTIGAGGGLLNGETQKAIMSVVPRKRAGMASGISTTSRFAGMLLGFAMLSGILATIVRHQIASVSVSYPSAFADSVIAGDLHNVLTDLTGSARISAIKHAHQFFSDGFAIALFAAAGLAGGSALLIFSLMSAKTNA